MNSLGNLFWQPTRTGQEEVVSLKAPTVFTLRTIVRIMTISSFGSKTEKLEDSYQLLH